MEEFVEGLMGMNKAYIDTYLNHYHVCELKILGLVYGSKKKEVESFCPNKVKYKDMNNKDICEECEHSRCIKLSDDGNHIIGVE